MPRSRSSAMESMIAFHHSFVGAEHARLAQQGVDQGGFAVVDVGDDCQVAYVVAAHVCSLNTRNAASPIRIPPRKSILPPAEGGVNAALGGLEI